MVTAGKDLSVCSRPELSVLVELGYNEPLSLENLLATSCTGMVGLLLLRTIFG